jgi:hypothetical protein
MDIHLPSVECELAALCLNYLTFSCFDLDAGHDPQELKQLALKGHFAFQDYAIAKWSHHINAFVSSGAQFMEESTTRARQLEDLSVALDGFLSLYGEEDWDQRIVDTCRADCHAFEGTPIYDGLVLLTSHIHTLLQKGLDARDKISIKNLASALERNRKVLEELPSSRNFSMDDFATYCKFYDHERLFKCPQITCHYFSEGFKDSRTRTRHINHHDRSYTCVVLDCLGGEGFANQVDLKRYVHLKHCRPTV